MAKQFRDNTSHFDRDLDAILDRVYGQSGGAERPTGVPKSFVRQEQDSQELKQALADLRDRRERSQGDMRMKEEVDYLKEQIEILRNLTRQIDALRQQLENDT